MDEEPTDRHAESREKRKRKERQGMQVDGRSTKSLFNDRLEVERIEMRQFRSSIELGKHVNAMHNGYIQSFCPECNDIALNRRYERN